MSTKVVVVDYGCGNIRSVFNALKAVSAEASLVSNPDDLIAGDKIILPGVGAFPQAMAELHRQCFVEALDHIRAMGRPVLGICLGMQLLCSDSDEGELTPGLGWIDAQVRHFRSMETPAEKVPHMGWNELHFSRSHKLLDHIAPAADVYFVHSHAVTCQNEEDVLTYSEYGSRFVSSFARDNVYGMQFHPEKSHKVGLQLLKNFVEL